MNILRSYMNIIVEGELKEKFKKTKLSYEANDLEPVMSKHTIDLHHGILTANYIKKANATGDKFQIAGAYLHSLWWDQLKDPANNNKPSDAVLDLINKNYSSFADFKDLFTKEALSIEGNGWCVLLSDGSLTVIPNHEKIKNIVLLLDMWEHAYIFDYGAKKEQYINNFWKIIDWDKLNQRVSK